MSQVIVLADTPNLFRTVQTAHGPAARPDYDEIYRAAHAHGEIVRAIGFVNEGVNTTFVQALGVLGFEAVYSEARDVDHALISTAVELSHTADRLILCSGDGDYCPLARLLRRIGLGVTVIAEPTCCSRWLRSVANRFIPVPLMHMPLTA